MQKIILRPIHHQGEEWIGIYFTHNVVINTLLSKKAGAKWSQSNKCWYVPLNKENYKKIAFALTGKVDIQQKELYQYLSDKKKKRKDIPDPIPVFQNRLPVVKQPALRIPQYTAITNHPKHQVATNYKGEKIYAVNAHIIPAMREHLMLKAYSLSTIRTYRNEMTQLLNVLTTIAADELTPAHLKRYLVYCFEKLNLSENTLHSRINALKFYYEQVLGREKFFWEIPRPKKPLQLPRFFSQNDIVSILQSTGNIKHKVMLMLPIVPVYGSAKWWQ